MSNQVKSSDCFLLKLFLEGARLCCQFHYCQTTFCVGPDSDGVKAQKDGMCTRAARDLPSVRSAITCRYTRKSLVEISTLKTVQIPILHRMFHDMLFICPDLDGYRAPNEKLTRKMPGALMILRSVTVCLFGQPHMPFLFSPPIFGVAPPKLRPFIIKPSQKAQGALGGAQEQRGIGEDCHSTSHVIAAPSWRPRHLFGRSSHPRASPPCGRVNKRSGHLCLAAWPSRRDMSERKG